MSEVTGSASSSSTTTAFAASNPSDREGESAAQQSDVPLLPAADPDSKLPSIKLGETISFEEMGPVIINTDGTTRRIDNWDSLTENEKKVTWRRISKRNEERRQALLQKMQQEQEEKGGAGIVSGGVDETKEL
jgi:hypothetical protein